MIPSKCITLLITLFTSFHFFAQQESGTYDLVIENSLEFIEEWLPIDRELVEVTFFRVRPDRVDELMRSEVKDSLRYGRFKISLGAKDSLYASATCLVEYNSDNYVSNVFMNQHNAKLLHDIQKISSETFELDVTGTLSSIEPQTQLHLLENDGYKFVLINTETERKMDFMLELVPYLKDDESHHFYRSLAELTSMEYAESMVLKITSNGVDVTEKNDPLKLLTVMIRPNYALCATDQRILYLNLENNRVIKEVTERSWSPTILD